LPTLGIGTIALWISEWESVKYMPGDATMAEIDKAFAFLLTQPTARKILDKVVQYKLIQVRDLVKQTEPDANAETTKGIVRELKDLRLIDEKTSAIDDFNTLYVTAAGLEANRKIGQY
jgi:hypothetical protein